MFIYKMSIEWCLSWCCMQELYLDVYSLLYVVSKMNLNAMEWHTEIDNTNAGNFRNIFSLSITRLHVRSFFLRKSLGRFCTRIISIIIIMDFTSFAVTIIIVVNIIWHKYSMNEILFFIDLRSGIRVLHSKNPSSDNLCIYILFDNQAFSTLHIAAL